MKERPILFSGPMVRAILSGTKTQTRRILKLKWGFDLEERDDGTLWPWAEHPDCDDDVWMPCPQGEIGDRLWVRETHMNWWKLDPANPEGPRIFSHVAAFAADGYELEPGERWIPSIHMLRAASRITLDIKAVRVERLQDISEEDAKAEGAPGYEEGLDAPPPDGDHEWSYRASFQRLWEQINGPGAWAKNPWVWVVEFERAQAQQKGQTP